MDVKKLALLVGALVIAVVTAVMAKNMFAGAGAQQAAAAPAVPVGPKVLVAKKALPVGTIIDPDSFTFQPWPKELMQGAYYVEGQPDSKSLAGTVVRYAIAAGQPVTRGSLVGPQDRGFLAAALGPGMRAVTVPVNTSSGVAGFVFPGDHVDLVLTQQVSGGGDGPPLKVSETIVRERPRPRDRPALHRQGRGWQDCGQDRFERDLRGHSEDRGEDRSRAEPGSAIAVAALDRRQYGRPGAGGCRRRHQGSDECEPDAGARDAARLFGPSGRYKYNLHDRRRCVALPAPHCPQSSVRACRTGQRVEPGECRLSHPRRTRRPHCARQQCHRRSGGSSLK